MAYKHTNSKGVTYYLHANVRKLASGKEQKLYFFSKTIKAGALRCASRRFKGEREHQRASIVEAHLNNSDFQTPY